MATFGQSELVSVFAFTRVASGVLRPGMPPTFRYPGGACRLAVTRKSCNRSVPREVGQAVDTTTGLRTTMLGL